MREYIVVPPGQTPPPAAHLALPVDPPAPGAPWAKPAAPDALWVITDRRPLSPDVASAAATLGQMARQGCRGVYADFERSPGKTACRFLAALQAKLTPLHLPLLVPAAYASLLPGAACVLTWQPGGGAFSAVLQAACAKYANRACWLDLASVACRVQLGSAAPPERLAPAALAAALAEPPGRGLYNAPLGCYYKLARTEDAVFCTLFDTAASFQSRRRQAACLPLAGLFLLQPELDALSSVPAAKISAQHAQKTSYQK